MMVPAMSMRYLIDGHNAIYALDIEAEDPKSERRLLLHRVRATRPEAIVFFDARRGSRDQARTFVEENVRVVYCHSSEADDEILAEVDATPHPREVTVVTNDRRLERKVRERRAYVVDVETGLRMKRRPAIDEKAGAPMDFRPSDFGLPDEIDLSDPDLVI